MKIAAEFSGPHEGSRLHKQKTSGSEPTSTVTVERLDDVHTTPDCTNGGIEAEGKTAPEAE
jgi:hypothetical protein